MVDRMAKRIESDLSRTEVVVHCFAHLCTEKAMLSRPSFSSARELSEVANIGAVIMPFMLFFQQSAVVTRQLKPGADEHAERVTESGVRDPLECGTSDD